MGHLLFVGFLLFFVIIIVGRIYFDYKSATRKKAKEEVCLVEIPIDGKHFIPKTSKRLFHFSLIPIYLLFTVSSCIYLRQKTDPDAEIIYWLLVDMTLPVLAVLVLAFLKSIRSYIYICPEGFEYRDVFRVKTYSKDEIEGVYSTSGFVFVKRKSHKMPAIIENGFGNHDSIYKMLYRLCHL